MVLEEESQVQNPANIGKLFLFARKQGQIFYINFPFLSLLFFAPFIFCFLCLCLCADIASEAPSENDSLRLDPELLSSIVDIVDLQPACSIGQSLDSDHMR